MMVNDWSPAQENQAVTSFMNDLKPYMYDKWNKTGECFGGSAKAPNGVSAATFRFNSALINGRGNDIQPCPFFCQSFQFIREKSQKNIGTSMCVL